MTIPGNDRLALRLIDGKPKALIETRGEGGGILADPTLGYETLQGDFCDLPAITPKERQILWEAARSLNEFIDPKKIEGMGRRIPKGARRPGDDFNERGEVAPILKKHGWQPVGERGPYQYWRRPGKDRGTSASFIEEKIFYNFSANAHLFNMGTAYSPFAVFAFIEHDGDYEAAVKALRQEGYGEEPEKGGQITDSVQVRALLEVVKTHKDEVREILRCYCPKLGIRADIHDPVLAALAVLAQEPGDGVPGV